MLYRQAGDKTSKIRDYRCEFMKRKLLVKGQEGGHCCQRSDAKRARQMILQEASYKELRF